jgi:hypothetical protein
VNLIWATRGRSWGFRFLSDGGYEDPLPVYDAAFNDGVDAPEFWRTTPPTADWPALGALRFLDPLGRTDTAGRVIPHEFVVFDEWTSRIKSVEEGRQSVWPEVSDEFDRVWSLPRP